MNFRSQAIVWALDHISSSHRGRPLNIIEVGCMFKEDEGLSTYLVADFLAKRPGGGRFVSIEYEPNHIDASKEVLQKRHPSLDSFVEYRQGHSLSVLPDVLADLRTVHFFYFDGGGHPEVCLAEFEQAVMHLAPEGVILVDDAQELPPSANYGLARPFGKATLILPMLIVANYLRSRDIVRTANSLPGDERSIPDSRFIRQQEDIAVPTVNSWDFAVIGNKHQILVYGSPSFTAEARKLAEAVKPADIGLRSLISAVKRKIGRFISEYRWGIQREIS